MQESPGDLGQKGQQTRQLMAHNENVRYQRRLLNSIIGKESRAPDSSAVTSGESSRTE
jgi:hypothetical protein